MFMPRCYEPEFKRANARIGISGWGRLVHFDGGSTSDPVVEGIINSSNAMFWLLRFTMMPRRLPRSCLVICQSQSDSMF